MKANDTKIIKLLIENKENNLSINSLAKLLKKDYKNVHNITSRLKKAGIIELQPFGKSYIIKLKTKISPLIFEAEYERKEELLKNKDITIMQGSFNKLHSKLYILLVFGSYAKKTNKKDSDIDLMFIVPDEAEEKMEKEIDSIARTLPLKMHITIFKETDFKAMKNSKETTVGSEAMKNNIILNGIESYYERIK
ncbi:nucleotidyltransferase domain-containing protein [Candidatus Woesearchaeota archaeon]|nr:nucleotidyltransferase domain-containing protein [Candidatus Woesearchaeota archaeon]